ncbi:MAG: chemotaxis protein CheW, partial [Deltaproteobacteria bacterium]
MAQSTAAAAVLAEDSEQIKQLVSFILGKEEFGVDILMVQEIIRLATITPIPNAPEFIEGVINLRGKVIPI